MAWRVLLLALLALALSACGGEDDSGLHGGGGYVGVIGPASLDAMGVGVPYNASVQYTGYMLPAATLVWSATPSLPPGLMLAASTTSSTVLSGTPTASGSYSFNLVLTQDDGSTTFVRSAHYDLYVHPAGELYVVNGSLPDGSTTSAYSQTLTAQGGTGVGYTWSVVSGALPPGLALNGNNVTLAWGAFAQTGAVTQSIVPRLSEVSGICASRSQPGVCWVHDDSNNAASIYALDAAGALLQRYDLSTTNGDWEDICLGPGPGGDCLYIGDIGDNASARTNCHLLRVTEPVVPATPQAPIALAFEAFYFTYPGGAQNCESLLIDWDSGTPYLVEKTSGAVRVHRFPMPLNTAWTAGSPTTLIAVTSTITGNLLTGGDASLDARRVILRNGGAATEYARPMGASFDAIFTQTGTAVGVPGGQQYEAICYSADGTKLFSTTEIASGTSQPIWSSDATPGPNTTTLSGTPTTLGTFTFTVQVKDSAGNVDTQQLTLVVR